MTWSYSDSQTFRRCQRRWFFKKHVANANAKDIVRQTAYRLSKLQSISAWRGSVVDKVLSDTLVPAITQRRLCSAESLRRTARELFDRQLSFARKHLVLSPDIRPAKAGDDFAAFHCIEYGQGPSEEDISRAWNDIEESFLNLFEMEGVLGLLRSAVRICAQPPLSFRHSDVTVRAHPDVVIFLSGSPPIILDWKVHAFGLSDAYRQLGIYAIALIRGKPHFGFPSNLSKFTPRDVRLLEVQLLRKAVREYRLSEDDELDTEAYIAESVTEMLLALGEGAKSLKPSDFPPAYSGETCHSCQFRRLCWEEN